MQATDIIANNAFQKGADPVQHIAGVASLIQRGAKIFQANNSVLLLVPVAAGIYDAHLISNDPPLVMSQSIAKLITEARMAGVQVICGKGNNPNMFAIMHRAGLNIMPSRIPGYNWMAQI